MTVDRRSYRFWNHICRVFGLTSGPSLFAKTSLIAPSGFLHTLQYYPITKQSWWRTHLFPSYALTRISSCSFVGLNLGGFISPMGTAGLSKYIS